MAKKQNFIHGAAILTVGVIIMKLLGFIYKIPLGNILGDEGYSMFTSAYSIYFIFFTLATAGLPVGGKDFPRCARDLRGDRRHLRADPVPVPGMARREVP